MKNVDLAVVRRDKKLRVLDLGASGCGLLTRRRNSWVAVATDPAERRANHTACPWPAIQTKANSTKLFKGRNAGCLPATVLIHPRQRGR